MPQIAAGAVGAASRGDITVLHDGTLRATSVGEASQLSELEDMAERVRKLLARIDLRLNDRPW